MKPLKLLYLFVLLFLFSCVQPATEVVKTKAPVIHLQPFEGISKYMVSGVQDRLNAMGLSVVVHSFIPLPAHCFYAPRNRYRADSLIKYLKEKSLNGEVVLGLTDKDISVTKGTVVDYGIMGLGYQPGKGCVISTFRLKTNRNVQFQKLALHELGHTQGLPHCDTLTCYMRDAEGKNHFEEQDGFCEKCKEYLQARGWLLTKDE